jgi:hypothetical protein
MEDPLYWPQVCFTSHTKYSSLAHGFREVEDRYAQEGIAEFRRDKEEVVKQIT